MFPEKFHRFIFWVSLVLIATSLPFSVFALSVAQITLAVNWILEGKFRLKWERLKSRKAIWLISLLYLVHLLWFINTSDFGWGLHDLRIKLPMLALPLFIGTSESITETKLKTILNFYLVAILVATLYSAYYIFGLDGSFNHSITELSPFVSHIRLSLMVAIAIFTSIWLLFKTKKGFKWLYLPLGAWYIFYLFIFQALTGIAVFMLTAIAMLVWALFQYKQLMFRWFMTVMLLTIVLLTSTYITHSYARFHTFEKINPAKLDKTTQQGNAYLHDTSSRFIENGHYIYINICEPELKESWNLRSNIDFHGKTHNGHDIKNCLIRYLASKGLKKDASGMDQLTNREIEYIEMGKTNHIDTFKYSLYPKIYTAMWELYSYKHGANPTGYSISQRIEFLKTAFHIIRTNIWFGVGTGDIPNAFAEQYETDKSPLAPESRLRTHNQFITFIITFGIIGFLLILCALFIPPMLEKKYTDYLFLSIFIIGLLSFLNEDMLETHQGISTFALFYTLFLFYKNDNPA